MDRGINQRIEEIKAIYNDGNAPNILKEGDMRYPEILKSSSGMEVKFDNVSFARPKAENVIENVSFTISRGQTVVIVGVNGSGKSTLFKLFNRRYDPAPGTISIDGIPMRSFIVLDVRKSSVMLSQSYTHFPLSIQESVSMGLPDSDYRPNAGDEKNGQDGNINQEELVNKETRLGGSAVLIDKQPKGLGTVLHPKLQTYAISKGGGQAFREKMEEITKTAEVSLGQWQ